MKIAFRTTSFLKYLGKKWRNWKLQIEISNSERMALLWNLCNKCAKVLNIYANNDNN